MAAGKRLIGLGVLGMFLGVFTFDAIFTDLADWGIRSFPQSMILPLLLDVSYGALAITLGVTILLLMALADRLDPGKRFDKTPEPRPPLWRREWGWVSTGTLAGLIILSASAQDQYFGISGGFAALTAHVMGWFGYSLDSVPVLNDTTVWRAAMVFGLIPGVVVSAMLSRSFKHVLVTPLWDMAFDSGVTGRATAVFLGGFLIMFGALIGGGCTTGAFMSGFPTLSVGSFVMGMTFFGTGMITAFLLYWGKWRLITEVKSKGLDLATD